MKTTIDFATTDDLEALADLLAELFTLESDFRPERNQQLRGLRLILDNRRSGDCLYCASMRKSPGWPTR